MEEESALSETLQAMMNETQSRIALILLTGVNENEDLGNVALSDKPTRTNRSKLTGKCAW